MVPATNLIFTSKSRIFLSILLQSESSTLFLSYTTRFITNHLFIDNVSKSNASRIRHIVICAIYDNFSLFATDEVDTNI